MADTTLKMTKSHYEKSLSRTTRTINFGPLLCDLCLWIDALPHSLWMTKIFRKSQIEALWCLVWRHDLWLASICDCGTICDHIMLQFVTRHDLWPKVLQFVTSVIQWFYSPSCAGGKLVFVFTLIMYTKWYNMIIYIYELWYNTYINSGARSLMLFTLILFEYHAWHIYIIYHICVSYFMHHP